MNYKFSYLNTLVRGLLIMTMFVFLFNYNLFPYFKNYFKSPPDTSDKDSNKIDLHYPFQDYYYIPYSETYTGGLFLNNPSNINTDVEYDPDENKYYFQEKIGDNINFRNPTYMTFDEYLNYDFKKRQKEFWKQKSEGEEFEKGKLFRPSFNVESEFFDRIFGGNTIDISPRGSAELTFGISSSKTQNPQLPERQQQLTTFDFDQKIQLSVDGNIGEKLKLNTNFNSEATFDFENKIKIGYTGDEDQIIQSIEAGNVSLPLKGSLITGSQSLLGIKTKLKFGKLTVTTILSQDKGEKKEIEIKGGAQVQEFEVSAADYEANKHYFLSQYFRDNYERALQKLPVVNSGINITKIEVWVTNKSNSTQNTRNIIAFMDLGESDPHIYRTNLINDKSGNLPDNSTNDLYDNLKSGFPNASKIRTFVQASQTLDNLGFVGAIDYEKVENARLLSPNEYKFNAQLGYISLNQSLNSDEVLAVAFQYTYNGKTYQVGEFSTDGITGTDALYLKMLKSTTLNTKLPIWDLMMKNVYSLGAYQISPNDFRLEIWYLNPETGYEINYLPKGSLKGKQLLQLLRLDQINQNNNPKPDGMFDFIPNVTINPSNGRIYFPVLEPFGDFLRSKFPQNEQNLADQFAFDSLYTTTQLLAKQDANKNRFKIKGTYQSSVSSEISLGAMNIPKGSVKVTAGGAVLQENIDYTVDYNLGRVKIINQGILQSGTAIKVSLESNSLFNIQQKNLIGARFDYDYSDKINFGGTILHLSQRPLTQKVNIGDEPISNTIWGVDGTYSSKSDYLTYLLNYIPFVSTKAPSSITATGEFAYLIPGNSRAIGKKGSSYIDDFEGSQSTIDLSSAYAWKIASVPQGQPDLFPEGNLKNNIVSGFNRAKLAWYTIDPLFFRNDSRTPEHIKNDKEMQSNHFMREILETEIFPNKSPELGQVLNIPVLDLAFYPSERGPYNFDTKGVPGISAGLNSDGSLKSPKTRWGGIMRSITTTDFESANIEFIQFWLMDPFNEDGNPNSSGGDLYFNIGNISEDVLNDSRKSFENGLPTNSTVTNVDTTVWGRVPTTQSVVNAFDNNESARQYQDVGLDGLSDNDEKTFFKSYLDSLKIIVSQSAYDAFKNDPSNDNYHYYRGSDYDSQQLNILERYKMYNGFEGNSPTSKQSPESYPTAASTLPDIEDINLDNNLNENESYFQYRVKITPQDLQEVGKNFITDIRTATVTTADGRKRTIKWYQFKIPVREPDKVIGNIQDFRSIRFMRIFLKSFDEPVILRFARLELVRGEWRKYNGNLLEPGEYITDDEDPTSFDISAVNVEENSNRVPINYVTPPGIQREVDIGTTNLRLLNEQSMVLNVCNLKDGDSRAAYKTMDLDVRQYKFLRMFAHLETNDENKTLNYGDLHLFVRIGTDFDNNYYEYEIPLQATKWGSTIDTDIWPEINNVDIEFSKLKKLKQERDLALLNGSNNVSIIAPYEKQDGKSILRVKGRPNISKIKVIMIGVKNPKASENRVDDDGSEICAQVWVNELRLTDFNNKGGWATTGRVSTNLADLGNLTISGSYSTPGFGSLEKKVFERQLETRKQYDITSNLQLDKFLPEFASINLPLFYNISESFIIPQYNPLDPDIDMKDIINTKNDASYIDSIKNIAVDYTKRKGFALTNVKIKDSPKKKKKQNKKHFYDPKNISISYGYNEIFKHNINIEKDIQKTYKGGISYIFNNSGLKPFEPFKNFKKLKKSKYLKLISDFNLYFAPQQISYTATFNRLFAEQKLRNLSAADVIIIPTYNKNFTINRNFSFKYKISKSLGIDFNSSTNSRVLEPDEPVDKDTLKEAIIRNLKRFGSNNKYHQTTNIKWTIPVNKIPITSWINVSSRYTANFDWTRAPFNADSIGNTIQNSRTLAINGNANFLNLYNKITFLKKINQKYRGGKGSKKKIKNKLKVPQTSKSDTSKEEKEKKEIVKKIIENALSILMGVKSATLNYTLNGGTSLPGFADSTYLFGMNRTFISPGWDFVLGNQDPLFPAKAAEKGWLVKENSIFTPYSRAFSENLSARISAEPINKMRVSINFSKKNSTNYQSFFRWNDTTQTYENQSPVETGSFSISYNLWRTAFIKDDKNDYSSPLFNKLLETRKEFSQKLANKNPNSTALSNGYYSGYGETQQDVLILSFLTAYSGASSSSISTELFSLLPRPNWNITYTGLNDIPIIKKYFSSLKISHSYRSTFNINSYKSNLNYKEDNNNNPVAKDINGNFISKNLISTVSLSEQIAPLISFDGTLHNSLLTKIEINKDRNLSLSLANAQVTEIKGTEFVIGSGYRIKNVKFPIKIGANKKLIRSDLNIRLNFSIRKNITIIRKIVERTNQITSGQNIISIKLTGDYVINSRLNLRLFFDKNINHPFISTSFPTSNTKAGISLRFTLG